MSDSAGGITGRAVGSNRVTRAQDGLLEPTSFTAMAVQVTEAYNALATLSSKRSVIDEAEEAKSALGQSLAYLKAFFITLNLDDLSNPSLLKGRLNFIVANNKEDNAKRAKKRELEAVLRQWTSLIPLDIKPTVSALGEEPKEPLKSIVTKALLACAKQLLPALFRIITDKAKVMAPLQRLTAARIALLGMCGKYLLDCPPSLKDQVYQLLSDEEVAEDLLPALKTLLQARLSLAEGHTTKEMLQFCQEGEQVLWQWLAVDYLPFRISGKDSFHATLDCGLAELFCALVKASDEKVAIQRPRTASTAKVQRREKKMSPQLHARLADINDALVLMGRALHGLRLPVYLLHHTSTTAIAAALHASDIRLQELLASPQDNIFLLTTRWAQVAVEVAIALVEQEIELCRDRSFDQPYLGTYISGEIKRPWHFYLASWKEFFLTSVKASRRSHLPDLALTMNHLRHFLRLFHMEGIPGDCLALLTSTLHEVLGKITLGPTTQTTDDPPTHGQRLRHQVHDIKDGVVLVLRKIVDLLLGNEEENSRLFVSAEELLKKCRRAHEDLVIEAFLSDPRNADMTDDLSERDRGEYLLKLVYIASKKHQDWAANVLGPTLRRTILWLWKRSCYSPLLPTSAEGAQPLSTQLIHRPSHVSLALADLLSCSRDDLSKAGYVDLPSSLPLAQVRGTVVKLLLEAASGSSPLKPLDLCMELNLYPPLLENLWQLIRQERDASAAKVIKMLLEKSLVEDLSSPPSPLPRQILTNDRMALELLEMVLVVLGSPTSPREDKKHPLTGPAESNGNQEACLRGDHVVPWQKSQIAVSYIIACIRMLVFAALPKPLSDVKGASFQGQLFADEGGETVSTDPVSVLSKFSRTKSMERGHHASSRVSRFERVIGMTRWYQCVRTVLSLLEASTSSLLSKEIVSFLHAAATSSSSTTPLSKDPIAAMLDPKLETIRVLNDSFVPKSSEDSDLIREILLLLKEATAEEEKWKALDLSKVPNAGEWSRDDLNSFADLVLAVRKKTNWEMKVLDSEIALEYSLRAAAMGARPAIVKAAIAQLQRAAREHGNGAKDVNQCANRRDKGSSEGQSALTADYVGTAKGKRELGGAVQQKTGQDWRAEVAAIQLTEVVEEVTKAMEFPIPDIIHIVRRSQWVRFRVRKTVENTPQEATGSSSSKSETWEGVETHRSMTFRNQLLEVTGQQANDEVLNVLDRGGMRNWLLSGHEREVGEQQRRRLAYLEVLIKDVGEGEDEPAEVDGDEMEEEKEGGEEEEEESEEEEDEEEEGGEEESEEEEEDEGEEAEENEEGEGENDENKEEEEATEAGISIGIATLDYPEHHHIGDHGEGEEFEERTSIALGLNRDGVLLLNGEPFDPVEEHSDDESLKVGDVIGVGVDIDRGCVVFTKNGALLRVIGLRSESEDDELAEAANPLFFCPIRGLERAHFGVGMNGKAKVIINGGVEPFAFDFHSWALSAAGASDLLFRPKPGTEDKYDDDNSEHSSADEDQSSESQEEEEEEEVQEDMFDLRKFKHVDESRRYFTSKSRIGVATADQCVPQAMSEIISASLSRLASTEPPDYHPGSNGKVLDLIHPSLYPYIEGISLPTYPEEFERKKQRLQQQQQAQGGYGYFSHRNWESSKYQWLPADVFVEADGTARFLSYVNNLNGDKFPELLVSLEKLFSLFVPMFETVLGKVGSQLGYPPDVRCNLRNRKLQVIVKAADYVLRPGESYEGTWHVEGMSHEYIVASGIYYVSSSECLSDEGLGFRRERDDGGYDDYPSHDDDRFCHDHSELEMNITLGTVRTPPGRLLAFSNNAQHKVLGVKNTENPSTKQNERNAGEESDQKMGRRRIVCFFLVSPDHEIISSADIPQQQWTREATVVLLDSVLSQRQRLRSIKTHNGTGKGKRQLVLEDAPLELPPEILLRIAEFAHPPGISLKAAHNHRRALMKERKFIIQSENKGLEREYSLCEH